MYSESIFHGGGPGAVRKRVAAWGGGGGVSIRILKVHFLSGKDV